jgi:ribosome-associated heat shock protein Hsp15
MEQTRAVDTTRVDRWLWAVRVYSTRSEATEACRGGHVRIDGRTAKPASPVVVGRRVEVRRHGRERVLEVVRLIDKRVGAAAATECFVDHSPPAPARERPAPVATRDRGAGRPTKRDRRRLDRLRDEQGDRMPWVEVEGFDG